MRGEIRLQWRPSHLQRFGRPHRVPFLLRDHGKEILDANHFGAGDVGDRAFIDRDRHGARDGRADRARVQHIGQLEIADLLQRAEHFARYVAARHRFADDLKLGRLLQRRLDFDGERLRLAREADRGVEIPAADKLGVGDALARIGERMHHAIRRHEVA